jgi:hypothetical protein
VNALEKIDRRKSTVIELILFRRLGISLDTDSDE